MKKSSRNVVHNPEVELLKNQMNKHGKNADNLEKRFKEMGSKGKLKEL